MFFGWQGVATFIGIAILGIITIVIFANILDKADKNGH